MYTRILSGGLHFCKTLFVIFVTMIDFLNLSENKSNCECLKLGYSMQLLPYQYDPYVLYIGDRGDFQFLTSIDVINIYGDVVNILYNSGDVEHDDYISLKNIQYNDNNHIVLRITLHNNLNVN